MDNSDLLNTQKEQFVITNLEDQKSIPQEEDIFKKLEGYKGPLSMKKNEQGAPGGISLQKEQELLKENMDKEEEKERKIDADLSIVKDEEIEEEKGEEEKEKEIQLEKNVASISKIMSPLDKLKPEPPSPEEARKKIEDEKEKLQRDTMLQTIKEFAESFLKNDTIWKGVPGDLAEGSASFKELRYASVQVEKLCNMLSSGKIDIDINTCIDAFSRLSQAATDYYHEHRGHRSTKKGKARKAYAESLRDKTRSLFKAMGGNGAGQAVQKELGNNQATEYSKAEKKKAEEKVKELRDMKKKWSKHIARNATDALADDRIRDRLNMFLAYEEDLKVYRATHKPQDMDREIRLLYEEYESVLTEMYVKDWAKAHGKSEQGKQKNTRDLIQKHIEEEDERKHQEPMEKEKVDKSLSPEQLKGIAEIDQWLVRNFNNGGMLRFIPALRNHHGEFVSRILSMSKRERLHMYYLVETRERKDATPLDAVLSQTEYIPNLKEFRNQMRASRWKLTKYVTGGYIYMHKLSEAFQITQDEKTQNAIKDCATLAGQLKKDKEKKEDNRIDLLAGERLLSLGKFQKAMKEYKRALRGAQNAPEDKKLETEAKNKAIEAQRFLREMVRYDSKLRERVSENGLLDQKDEKTKVARQEYMKKQEDRNLSNLYMSVGSAVASNAHTIAKKAGNIIGFSWGLEENGFKDLELWGGSVGNSISVANGVLNLANQIYFLNAYEGDLTQTEYDQRVAGIIATAYSTIGSGLKVAKNVMQLFKMATDSFGVQVVSNLATGASVGSVLFSAIETGNKWKAVYNQSVHAKNAHEYFDRKREKVYKEKPQTEEEIKQWRKNKYEQGMLKLSDKMRERNRNQAIYSTIKTGIGAAAFIPGANVATVAAGLGLTLATTIADAYQMGKVREATFDHYFNLDKIAEQVWKETHGDDYNSHTEDEQEDMKKRLRRRVAAAAGFCHMAAAQEHVAMKYAEYIHGQLFGEQALQGEERDAYIQLVRSLGLPYDAEKHKPSIAGLRRKMTGK